VMSTDQDDPERAATRAGSSASAVRPATRPRFVEDSFRPFVLALLSAATVVQLVVHPPDRLPVLIWALAVATIAAAAAMVVPWSSIPENVRVALSVAFAVLGALVFALSPNTASVVFVYLAAEMAGERLVSRRAAFVVAGVGTGVAVVASRICAALVPTPGETTWWLALTVGLPVYIGIARRGQADALAAASEAAVQSRRAAASEAREAALEERGRIAREIHDVLGHALSGVALQLDMADALHAADRDAEANEAVRRARSLAVTGMGETRRAIHALREDTLPLPATLARLAQDNGAEHAVVGEPGPISVEVTQAVLRAAQEAVTNARRHAPGAEVALRLEYRPESVRLTVTDTGPADQDAARPETSGSGLGLIGMRERAALLAGTVHAGPHGAGWQVELELPR
jgi:signal transduction histidine kinase